MNKFHFLLFIFAQSTICFSATIKPTFTTILTKQDFVGRPLFSVADALEGVASLNIERSGYQGTQALLKMRGVSNAEHALILMDGEPLSHIFDGNVDLSQIPINIVERIEISRGGGSISLPASGLGGVVNIITIRPEKIGLTARLGTGVGRDGVKHSHGQLTGRSRWGDATYLGSKEVSGGFLSNEDSENLNHFINFTRSFNGKGYWGGEYYFQKSKTGLGEGTLVPFSDWNGHLEQQSIDEFKLKKEETQHSKIIFATPSIWNGTGYFTATQRKREHKILQSEPGPAVVDQTIESLELEAKFRKKTWEMGLSQINSKRNLFPQNENNTWERSFYIFNKWVGEKWQTIPGVRSEHHSEAGPAYDARLTVLFLPRNTWNFSGSVNSSHRFPHFGELFHSSGVIANQNLAPEKSLSFNAGVQWIPSNAFSIQVNGFMTQIKDVITRDNSNQLLNAAREDSTGLETEVSIHLGQNTKFRHFRFRGNGIFQKNETDNPFNGLGPIESAMTPEALATLTLEYFLPRKLTLTNQVRLQAEQFENPGRNGLRLPSYAVWDARLGAKINSADLYFEAKNLMGKRYADTIINSQAIPQPERSFWAGLSIRFDN